MNFSNSTTDKTERLKNTKSLTFQWETIDWKQVEYDVNRLQTRIAKATAKGDKNKAKRLQYLLTHSFSAKAYAVRKVTTNKGKNKKRPLGIPTMYDRAMQTLYALTLEPIAETKGDAISFGFRRGRSAKDACEQIFCVLARKCSPTWILEGDIKGCFDNINHEWLQDNIPMDKRIMKQFLKSGFIYEGELFPTETASPQGGAISSIYANMTLDGLENVIQDKYHRNSKGKIENHYRAKTKVNLIRYADDFIITANSKEVAEELKTIVSQFLQSRELSLSEEKTMITHIDKGFDFLGWTFKKYKGKLIVNPSKSSIKNLIGKCSIIILREGKASTQSDLIRRLNQVISGWTNITSTPSQARSFHTLITLFITYYSNGQSTDTLTKINGGD